jgi:hypothetical protein
MLLQRECNRVLITRQRNNFRQRSDWSSCGENGTRRGSWVRSDWSRKATRSTLAGKVLKAGEAGT